jgi:hypothetical protein
MGVKLSHSPTISHDVKTEWSYTPTPPIHPHGEEGKFAVTVFNTQYLLANVVRYDVWMSTLV